MTLREAVSTCLSKYATFSGRASREEYWKFSAAYVIVIFGLAILYNITNWSLFGYVFLIVVLGSVVPFLSVGVRRLHDIGKPGTSMLIRLIPFAGDIIFFVYTIQESQPYANIYGPLPRPGAYPPPYWAGRVPPWPQEAPIPPGPQGATLTPAPEPVDESNLPFYQARRKAALEASGRQRYESGEPSLDSHKVDDYFAYASGERPPSPPKPKLAFSFSTMSRKTINIAGGIFILVVLVVGIFLGQNSWRPSTQDAVKAVGPPVQPAVPTQAPYTPPAPSPSPPQFAQAAGGAAATVAAPPQPTQPQTQLVVPTQASALPPGDLGLTSPLRPVGCTGQYIVVYHSSTDPTVYAQDIQTNLQSHPGSKYLLTLSSCSSLNRMSKAGTLIYTVYGGPFDTLAQACMAASQFPDESYVKIMDGTAAPDQAIRPCQ